MHEVFWLVVWGAIGGLMSSSLLGWLKARRK